MGAIPRALLVHSLILELGLLSLLAIDHFPHSLHHGPLTLNMLHHSLHVGLKLGQLLRDPLLESLLKLFLGHGGPS